MSEQLDAAGTLVVRVTLNPALRRAAFRREAMWALGCVLTILFIVFLARTPMSYVAWVPIAAILLGYDAYALPPVLRLARRKLQALSMGMPTLVLDDLGVTVRDVPMDSRGAGLAWTDCAAVVISKAPQGVAFPVQPRRYVQFVPVSDDRVEGTVRVRDRRRELVPGMSERAALLVWLELPGSSPDADDVVAWLREHQPRLRVVGAGHSVTDE